MRRILHLLADQKPGWAMNQWACCVTALQQGLLQQGGLSPQSDLAQQTLVIHGTPSLAQSGNLIRLGAARRWDWQSLRRAIALVQQTQPEVIHAWGWQAWRYAALLRAMLGSQGRRVRLIASVGRVAHAGQNRQAAPGSWLWASYLARVTQRVVVNTEPMRQRLIEYGWPGSRLALVPPVVEAFSAGAANADLRQRLGLSADARLIATVSNFTPCEHLKDLVWAADLLKVARDDVHLVVFGTGPLASRIERFRAQVRIADRVHLLGVEPDVRRNVAQCEFYWTSRSDTGASLPMLAAMRDGLTVMAAATADTVSLLAAGQRGALFDLGDRSDLASQTHWLLDQPDERRALSAAGREFVAGEFSLSGAGAALAELYRQWEQGSRAVW